MLRDRGLLRREGDVWRLDQGAVDVPETVQGIIAARLDALTAEEKTLLQDAAVVGKVFWLGAVAAIADLSAWETEELLHGLERKEFVRRERRGSVAGETEYAFRHVLTAMSRTVRFLARGARTSTSGLRSGSSRWPRSAPRTARRCSRTTTWRRWSTAGRPVSTTPRSSRRTVAALVAAGDRAAGLGALGSALAHYRHALSLDDSGRRGSRICCFGSARRSSSSTGVARTSSSVRLGHCATSTRSSPPRPRSCSARPSGSAVTARARPLISSAQRRLRRRCLLIPASRRSCSARSRASSRSAAGRARRSSSSSARSRSRRSAGTRRCSAMPSTPVASLARSSATLDAIGDLERSFEYVLEADPARAPRSYINLGSVLVDLAAEVERADQVFRDGLSYAERLSLGLALRWFRGNLSDTTFHLGRWDECLELADGEIDDPEPHYIQVLVPRRTGR